ncbi:MAG: UPF0179 family protein [Methanomethylophilus sp.]|jgi:uncharacterized protein (UPF0179 family)
MILLTLVSTEMAEEGRRFIYVGPELECRECKIKDICLNLEKGAEYRVKKVRRPVHDCPLTGERVQVVEVERVPRKASVETKYAMDGATVSFKAADCGRIGCEHYKECNPAGIDDGSKVTIEEMGEKADCPAGKLRTFVVIR